MTIGPVWLMQPIPYFGERLRGKWIYEPKIDGWRMQIISHKIGRVELWGRRLEKNPNWTGKLNMLVTLLDKQIPGSTVLDCELFSTGGRRFIPSLFAKRPKVEPIVYVFDILYYKGRNVCHQPLVERKKLLELIRFRKPIVVMQGNTLTDLQTDFSRAIHGGYEGIVIKHLDSPYRIGKEAPVATQDWRKVK